MNYRTRGTLEESNVATLEEDKQEIEPKAPIVTQELVEGPFGEQPTHTPEEQREKEVPPGDSYEDSLATTLDQGLQQTQPQDSTSIMPRWVSIPHSLLIYASLVRENKMLRVKNLRLKINLKMLREELEEHKAPEKLGYPATSPLLVAGEPLIGSKEKGHPRETKEVVVNVIDCMGIDKATQTKVDTKQNRGAPT